MRSFVSALACLLLVTPAFGFNYSENFEGGLGGWVARNSQGGGNPGANDTPALFSPTDSRLGQLVGGNLNNPGSQSVGYFRNKGEFREDYGYSPPWFEPTAGKYDGTPQNWLTLLLPSAVAPGTYDVTITVDVYAWAWQGEPKDGDGGIEYWPWAPARANAEGLGNRVLLLTDHLYDMANREWNSGDPLGTAGLRETVWGGSQTAHPDNSDWRQMQITGQITTTTGNLEIRLLNVDKFDGMQAVAWDNLNVMLVPEPATLALLGMGLPLLRRRIR